ASTECFSRSTRNLRAPGAMHRTRCGSTGSSRCSSVCWRSTRSRSRLRRISMADLSIARRVLQTEAAAILALVDRLDHRFDCAVELLRNCKGRVILTGMGKSGIICRKIAATLTSTGTPALFLHPAEAVHGDLGVIQSDDVVVALSYSGETDELLRLLETIRRLGARLIVVTGDRASTLGQAADVALDCSVTEEACPMNLVPTASTTAPPATADALAMTLLGIITDGDLRRRMERGGDILDLRAGDVMSRHPVSVPRSTLAAEALNIMERHKITSIVVAEGGLPKRVAGVLHLHDLWGMDMF